MVSYPSSQVNKMKCHKKQNGFTLIEVLIYIALFSMLVGGVLVSVYTMLESSGRDTTQTELLEEGNFLLDKIGWVMSDVQTIASPAQNATGTTLSITPWDVSVGNPIVVHFTTQNMTIKEGVNSAQQLNNTNVWLSNASFTHTYNAGQGAVPESITVTFTLNTRTPEGSVVSHIFSTIYYVKK
jgi:prepilin-type N-terminal cleavage/methylation domain-containing protein